MQKMEEVIYPEIEPGIICKEMIEQAYLDDERPGEAGRLHRLEPVVFDRMTAVRLEFKNILRIDHLWVLPNLTKLSLNCNKIEVIENLEMLTNLKELDLSFNYIEKIENLDKLVNLEVLSLFNNLITDIENLDALEKLQILSLGNNKIETVAGLQRFRFLNDLSVFNMEGNPIAKDKDFSLRHYIAAILPNVRYYAYALIADDFREEAKQKFNREIREIEAEEEMEISERTQRNKEERDAERLASSFVEHLNEHQLYESLWKGDEDGRIIMSIGATAQEIAEEYDTLMFNITQELYKYGLSKYEEREAEINDFMTNLEDGQNEIQRIGQNIIEDFLRYKEKLFENATNTLRELEQRSVRAEDEDSPENLALIEQFEKMANQFDDTINVIWQQLMSQEQHLHESIEETTVNFQRKLQEMMGKFVEKCQSYFGQLREVVAYNNEKFSEAIGTYIKKILATQDFTDVLPELRNIIEDRDAVGNLLVGMKDTHTSRIDEREDRLMTRSRQFIEEMIQKLDQNELERNRLKILEINSFLELMSESLQLLQLEIREEIINEE